MWGRGLALYKHNYIQKYIKFTQYSPQKTLELNQISEQLSKDLLHKLNIEMSVA
jgi:hypothetical protein